MLKNISDKKIFFFIILPLFVSAIFLLSVTSSHPAFGEVTTGIPQTTQEMCQQKVDPSYYDTERIYTFVECEGCTCADSGVVQFSFHGLEADCENKATEEDRQICYLKHTYASYRCSRLNKPEDIEACIKEFSFHPGDTYKYYLGPSGSLVNENKVVVNGWRTYFDGFDENMEHNIMTSILENNGEAMTFRQSSRDTEFRQNLEIEGYLWAFSNHAGVYFGANPKFGFVDYIDPVEARIPEIEFNEPGLPVIEEPVQWLSCHDSDEGVKILKSGSTEGYYNPGQVYIKREDENVLDNIIKKYFCAGKEMRYSEIPCPEGTLAYQGRCVDDAASRYPGMGLVDPDRGSGFDVSSYISGDLYNDLWVNTNYQNVISFPDPERNSQEMQIKKGLEVTGDVKTDRIIFQGKELIWSPPIEGDFILYYE